jgi:signal transduction histidine kinase
MLFTKKRPFGGAFFSPLINDPVKHYVNAMKSDATNALLGRWPVILATLTAVTGLCISLYLQSRIAQTEASTARLTAETLRLNTEQELDLFVEVLESVRALHALSDAVNQAAMDEFIEKGLVHQRAVLGAFGLAQRISPWLRIELEKQAETQSGTGYRILQQGPDGSWVPAGRENIYYPLTWQNRAEALNIPIGFNFSSLSDEARHTIERIERTRSTALVPSPVPFAKSNAPSYWVFSPVMPRLVETNILYAPPGAVIGFAVAILHPEDILKRVAALSASSPKLRLNLMAPPDPDAKETIRLINGSWIYRYPLKAIDAQWTFECSLPVTVTGRRSAVALIAGLIITALMTSQLLVLGGRTRKIEAKVRARTEDLRIANIRLEQNLHERAHLEEEMTELAARERRQIGRDLHDSLGQKLTGAVFLSRSLLNWFQEHGAWGMEHRVESTADCLPDIGLAESEGQRSEVKDRMSKSTPATSNQQPATQLAHAKTLNETLKSAVSQVRNMARGLAPVTLNDESLGEALAQLAEEMTGLYGVSCEVAECTGLPALDRKTKEQLYLIAREAVNNAARHAQAGRVTIRLTGSESGWKLSVTDDGKGLPGNQPAGEGMGIRIMRHRAGLIGAGFSISPAPGRGTCVEITSK